MEDYSEPAPESLFDNIMEVCGSEVSSAGRRKGRTVVLFAAGVAAAAAAAIGVLVLREPSADGPGIPDEVLITETMPSERHDSPAGNDGRQTHNDPIFTEIPDTAPAAGVRETTEAAASENFAGLQNSGSADLKQDETAGTGDRPGTGIQEKSTEKTESGDNEIDIMEHQYDWQDILIADAVETGTRRKPSFSIHASGFTGGTTSYSGYSNAVNTRASASQMKYGENSLAGIMMFNLTEEVNTETSHFLPLRAGISISWEFAPRWSIESGLSYSWLLSESRTGSDSYYIDSRQTLHYLGIPLNIGYSIWDNRWLRIYASAGGMVEKCIAGSVRSDYFYGNDRRNTEREDVTVRPLQWSAAASAGFQFRLSPLVGIYLEPGLIYHFDNGSDIETVYSDRPFNFNLNLGLRFSL